MKTRNLILLTLILLSHLSFSQTEVSGGITEDVTWTTEGAPYIVTGNIAVFSGVTLKIDPGVTVKFDNGTNLRIQGALEAIGTETDSIGFTSNDTSPTKTSWQNIFIEYTGTFVFEYVNLSHASEGLKFGHIQNSNSCYIKYSNFSENNSAMTLDGGGNLGLDIDSTRYQNNNNGISPWMENLNLSGCLFLNNSNGASLIESLVDNCTFSGNSNVALTGHTSTIKNSIFTNNYIALEQSFSGGSSASRMIDNLIKNNTIGLRITGNNPTATFTGNSLCNNTNYNVVNTSSYSGQNLSNNCWCTTNEGDIKQSIYDGAEDINIGLVIYTPLFDDGLNISLPDTVSICDGEPALLEAGNNELNPQYEWKSLGDESILSDSSTLLTSIEGRYILSMTTDCNYVSDTITLKNFDSPVSGFSTATSSCQIDTLEIQFNGELLDGLTLSWNLYDAQIIENQQDSLLKVKWSSYGIKEISLATTLNGCTSISYQSVDIIKTPSNDFTVQSQICEGESAFISYVGNASDTASYTWDFDDGTITSGEGAGPHEITWDSFGLKTISLSVAENGCLSESEVQEVNYSQYPSLSFEASGSICYNEHYEITFTGSNYTNLYWDFDGADVISGSNSGPYTLSWSSSGRKFINLLASNNGCSKDSTINVDIPERPYAPNICLVTVDEESSKNMLLWSYDLEAVNQFGIYRETNISGEYSLVEYIDGGLSNTYIDNQSSPAQQSNRYKITSLDSCGTETDLSNYHKTIHLTINKGLGTSWNLIWDGYEGFSFGTYRIYRSLDDGDFDLLTEIASNLASFTDTDVSTFNVAYQIEVVAPNSCGSNEGGRINQNSTSRSNIARSNNVLGAKSLGIQLGIYPNPTSDYINVNSPVGQLESYELMTLTGQVVQIGELIGKDLISLEGLKSGVYLMRVNSIEGSHIKRIVKK